MGGALPGVGEAVPGSGMCVSKGVWGHTDGVTSPLYLDIIGEGRGGHREVRLEGSCAPRASGAVIGWLGSPEGYELIHRWGQRRPRFRAGWRMEW